MDLKLIEMDIESILSLGIEVFYVRYEKDEYIETCHMNYLEGKLYYLEGMDSFEEWSNNMDAFIKSINKHSKVNKFKFYIVSEE